jgi:hypothetical protein
VETAVAAAVGQKKENFLTARVKKYESEINRLIVTFTEKLSHKMLPFLPPKSAPT